jgi:hypothetical protein
VSILDAVEGERPKEPVGREIPDPATTEAPTISRDTPLDTAKKFAKLWLYHDGVLATRYDGERWRTWNGGYYRIVSDSAMETSVSKFLDGSQTYVGNKGNKDWYNPKTHDINEGAGRKPEALPVREVTAAMGRWWRGRGVVVGL